MVNTLAAARVAAGWLQLDLDDALARVRLIAGPNAVHISDDHGWGVLVGTDLRPLLTEPGIPLEPAVVDFRAGLRTDYRGPNAA
jgi:hypothetical protein